VLYNFLCEAVSRMSNLSEYGRSSSQYAVGPGSGWLSLPLECSRLRQLLLGGYLIINCTKDVRRTLFRTFPRFRYHSSRRYGYQWRTSDATKEFSTSD
jgi:hypothetical protein